MTPPGSPCSQAKEAWTVFPSESWPRGCWPPSAPRPGWGSPLPPFQQSENDFLSSLLPRGPGHACSCSPSSSRNWSLCLAPAPPKSICCPHTAGTQCGSTFSISSGRSGSGGGCAGLSHGHHQGSSLSCGAGGISWDSPGCTLGLQTSSSLHIFIFLACFTSFLPHLPTL